MAAAPDDDARRTLAELEAKLRELERELLRGREPEAAAGEPPAAAPTPPEPPAAAPTPRAPPAPAPEPPPVLDREALGEARVLLDALRGTIDGLGDVAGRVQVEARAVVDEQGRTLARLEGAARAARRAEEAAVAAGRVASTVVVEAGPFADPAAVTALRDTLAAQPGARDAYVRGVEDGRAVIEVHLVPPPA